MMYNCYRQSNDPPVFSLLGALWSLSVLPGFRARICSRLILHGTLCRCAPGICGVVRGLRTAILLYTYRLFSFLAAAGTIKVIIFIFCITVFAYPHVPYPP